MKDFLEVHTISPKPGNETVHYYVRASEIISIFTAQDEYVKIGAAAGIDTRGGTLFVKESLDDLVEQMSHLIVSEP